MPEGRKSPYKFIPKPGAELGITFGEPVDLELFKGLLERDWRTGTRPGEADDARIKVSEILRQEVERLGKRVAGNMLGKPP
jgi:monolysocardiolipin acyltransferase